jgi:ATP-dependent Clp protease ATP-binding subunit ClpA
MGARPMARLIQDMIRKALADELLFGRLVSGGRVVVDLDDKDQITSGVFRRRKRSAARASQEIVEVE